MPLERFDRTFLPVEDSSKYFHRCHSLYAEDYASPKPIRYVVVGNEARELHSVDPSESRREGPNDRH